MPVRAEGTDRVGDGAGDETRLQGVEVGNVGFETFVSFGTSMTLLDFSVFLLFW